MRFLKGDKAAPPPAEQAEPASETAPPRGRRTPLRRKEPSTTETTPPVNLQPDPEAPAPGGRRPRTPRPTGATTSTSRRRTPANPNPGVAGETVAAYDASAPDLNALG